MLSVCLSLLLAGDRASKKKNLSGDICFWLQKKKKKERKKERKKRKSLILPTDVRDGDRDRPQPSPAALIGWQLVQNPTSLTTQQQIRKACTQPPPPVLRCRSASQPGAQRSL